MSQGRKRDSNWWKAIYTLAYVSNDVQTISTPHIVSDKEDLQILCLGVWERVFHSNTLGPLCLTLCFRHPWSTILGHAFLTWEGISFSSITAGNADPFQLHHSHQGMARSHSLPLPHSTAPDDIISLPTPWITPAFTDPSHQSQLKKIYIFQWYQSHHVWQTLCNNF